MADAHASAAAGLDRGLVAAGAHPTLDPTLDRTHDPTLDRTLNYPFDYTLAPAFWDRLVAPCGPSTGRFQRRSRRFI